MSFREDDRAVSNVIGAILVFGTIILVFSLYQSQVVPSQNYQVEYQHSTDIRADMVELRNAILTANSAGRNTYAEVDLGTEYPSRIITTNPPPAAGTLRTLSPRPIEVSATGSVPNLCPGTSGEIHTRSLRYSPNYNQFSDAPDIVYENTVLYLDFGDRQVPISDESLVQNGGDGVQIVPLNSSLSKSGTDTESIEPVPGNLRTTELEDATLTLPTNLSENHWENLLSEDIPAADVSVTDGNLTVSTSGEISLACSPIGLGQIPAGGSRGGAALDINPAGPNDVEFWDVTRSGNSTTVTFNNTADRDTNITEGRVSFYFASQTGGVSDPDPLSIEHNSVIVASNLEVADPTEQFDPDIELPGNDTRTPITFNFNDLKGNPEGDFFVVKFGFENGETGTYFVDVPS